MRQGIYASPIGSLRVCVEEGKVTCVGFIDEECRADEVTRGVMEGGMSLEEKDEADMALLEETCRQLDAYFAGERQAFDLPLAPKGTPFQQKAWEVLRTIPYGKTITYGEEARLMGQPRAARAVGGANHYNPICIIIPCHRVVAAHGLGGYGAGVHRKEYLLRLESSITSSRP